ncbi:hydrolase 2, exosortase A system-associated [Piscinibacter sp.]|uniref:hydrolase 2, exosortase A system-associated n=1 Tax=Piscinibacter sp. TaxID=1903157 RepID=UPI002584FC45|nr:hydrolase 2, exosortase A system-associated [Piscinibacter sp.]
MTSGGPIMQSGMLVDGPAGRRFRLVSRPASPSDAGTVVFVHAFAEEMNKSRRMVARTARALAAHGWTVVQTDLHGCGDSAGEFRDATWDAWCSEVRDELVHADRGRPLWLWGHRAGALLAAAAAVEPRPELHLMLWQPALSGAQHLQQFLRLHAGARIVGAQKHTGGPSPLQRLRAGECVEVGGYELAPSLTHGLENARLDLPAGWAGRVVWLELSALDPPALPVPAAQCIARWRQSGVEVDAQVFAGPAFWLTQEIEECDELLHRTVQAIAGSAPAMPRHGGTAQQVPA